MVDKSIIEIAKKYLMALQNSGLPVQYGILFGSQATGKSHEWSDIDIVVVSPKFDQPHRRKDINLLWHTTIKIDNRIEPIPCGTRQWEEDDSSAILEIARREGEKVKISDLVSVSGSDQAK